MKSSSNELETLLDKIAQAQRLSSLTLLPRVTGALQKAHEQLDYVFHVRFMNSLIQEDSDIQEESRLERLLNKFQLETKLIKEHVSEGQRKQRGRAVPYMKQILERAHLNIQMLSEKYEELEEQGVAVSQDIVNLISKQNPLKDTIIEQTKKELESLEQQTEEKKDISSPSAGRELLHKSKIQKKYFRLLKELEELKAQKEDQFKKHSILIGNSVYYKISERVFYEKIGAGTGNWKEEQLKIEKSLEQLKFSKQELNTDQILDYGYHIRAVERALKEKSERREELEMGGELTLEQVLKIKQE